MTVVEAEQCWALEREPWWEPPYLLHPARPEVKLGRSGDSNKVCPGNQVGNTLCLVTTTD